MKHFINKSNIGICLMRQFFQDAPYSHIYATSSLIDERTMYSNRGGTYLFPLYLYNDSDTSTRSAKQALNAGILVFESGGGVKKNKEEERTPNLNKEIVNHIAEKLGLTYTHEKENNKNTFSPY